MKHRTAAYSKDLYKLAMEAVRTFQQRYDEAQKFKRLIEPLPEGAESGDETAQLGAFDALLEQFAFRKNGTAPTFDGPFHDWYTSSFALSEIGHPDGERPPGRDIMSVVHGELEPAWFFAALDRYAAAIQGVLDRSAPARFSYQGFKIYNPERMGEIRCRNLLEGVDYVVALFKKRGVTDILRATVNEVLLAPKLESSQTSSGEAAGQYLVTDRRISLSGRADDGDKGTFLKHWVNEVFLHEIGHHVHLAYLSPEAKASWDASWDDIRNTRIQLDKALKQVTINERIKYFNTLQDTEWDLKKALARLKDPVDKIKFGVWLRKPDINDPLITAKQFRLTDTGKKYFAFWKDVDGYIARDGYTPGTPDFQRHRERVIEMKKDKLGLGHAYGTPIPQEVVAELSAGDTVFAKAISDAMAKLDIVSEYGKTNEKEDFAETFVAFMDAPEKITPTAKFRMQRALSLSGLYGKQVMRLARRVLARFEQAIGQRANLRA